MWRVIRVGSADGMRVPVRLQCTQLHVCLRAAQLVIPFCFVVTGFYSPTLTASQQQPGLETGLSSGKPEGINGGPTVGQLFIREYRVRGAHRLTRVEIEAA